MSVTAPAVGTDKQGTEKGLPHQSRRRDMNHQVQQPHNIRNQFFAPGISRPRESQTSFTKSSAVWESGWRWSQIRR